MINQTEMNFLDPYHHNSSTFLGGAANDKSPRVHLKGHPQHSDRNANV
jgi:hypothetical protein